MPRQDMRFGFENQEKLFFCEGKGLIMEEIIMILSLNILYDGLAQSWNGTKCAKVKRKVALESRTSGK